MLGNFLHNNSRWCCWSFFYFPLTAATSTNLWLITEINFKLPYQWISCHPPKYFSGTDTECESIWSHRTWPLFNIQLDSVESKSDCVHMSVFVFDCKDNCAVWHWVVITAPIRLTLTSSLKHTSEFIQVKSRTGGWCLKQPEDRGKVLFFMSINIWWSCVTNVLSGTFHPWSWSALITHAFTLCLWLWV